MSYAKGLRLVQSGALEPAVGTHATACVRGLG